MKSHWKGRILLSFILKGSIPNSWAHQIAGCFFILEFVMLILQMDTLHYYNGSLGCKLILKQSCLNQFWDRLQRESKALNYHKMTFVFSSECCMIDSLVLKIQGQNLCIKQGNQEQQLTLEILAPFVCLGSWFSQVTECKLVKGANQEGFLAVDKWSTWSF